MLGGSGGPLSPLVVVVVVIVGVRGGGGGSSTLVVSLCCCCVGLVGCRGRLWVLVGMVGGRRVSLSVGGSE